MKRFCKMQMNLKYRSDQGIIEWHEPAEFRVVGLLLQPVKCVCSKMFKGLMNFINDLHLLQPTKC